MWNLQVSIPKNGSKKQVPIGNDYNLKAWSSLFDFRGYKWKKRIKRGKMHACYLSNRRKFSKNRQRTSMWDQTSRHFSISSTFRNKVLKWRILSQWSRFQVRDFGKSWQKYWFVRKGSSSDWKINLWIHNLMIKYILFFNFHLCFKKNN